MTKKANIALYKGVNNSDKTLYYTAWSRDKKTDKNSAYGNTRMWEPYGGSYYSDRMPRCGGSGLREYVISRTEYMVEHSRPQMEFLGVFPLELFT